MEKQCSSKQYQYKAITHIQAHVIDHDISMTWYILIAAAEQEMNKCNSILISNEH